MTDTIEIIVLHHTRFGENSVVLHTLSREYGRRSFLVRNAGKRASLFLPLNILEADVTESTKSTLYTARNLTPVCGMIGIRNNVRKNAISMFIGEVLYRIVKEESYEAGLYDWCKKSILLLDALEADFSNFHIRFLAELAIALGFSPEASDLKPFAGKRFETVAELMERSFEESMLMPLSGSLRNEIAEIMLKYIEYHTESTVNIRSLKVLREFFG